MKNFIFQKESDDQINQIRINSKQALLLLSIFSCVFISFIYLSAEILTDILYDKRLNQYKQNYNLMSTELKHLQQKLEKIDDQVLEIEKKKIRLLEHMQACQKSMWI